MRVMMDKPRVKLVGTDGNIFAVVGRCKQALEQVGQLREAREMVRQAFKVPSYDEALTVCLEYVDAF